jgi:hypothetical protein
VAVRFKARKDELAKTGQEDLYQLLN